MEPAMKRDRVCFLVACVVMAVGLLLGSVSEAAGRTVRQSKRVRVRTLSDVCTRTTPLNGLLIKITAGGHISRGDARYSGYSIICASKCASFPATVYHCDGSTAFRMGYYGRYSENGKPRGYCAAGGAASCSVSAVRSRSTALKCRGAGYLDLDGSRGKSCRRLNRYSNRNGDV